jgi:hypothetical protein
MKLRPAPTTLSLLRERVGGGGAAKGGDNESTWVRLPGRQ